VIQSASPHQVCRDYKEIHKLSCPEIVIKSSAKSVTVLEGKRSLVPVLDRCFPTTTTTMSVRTQSASLRSTPCPRKCRRFLFFFFSFFLRSQVRDSRLPAIAERLRGDERPMIRFCLIKERCTQGNNKSLISISRRYDTSICHTFIRRLLYEIYQPPDLTRHVRNIDYDY